MSPAGTDWPKGCHQGDSLTNYEATGTFKSIQLLWHSNRRAHNHLSPRLLRLGPETKETGSQPSTLRLHLVAA